MNADQFNRLYPVGTRVVAYPGVRPEHAAGGTCTRLVTRTKTTAWEAGGHTAVVMVDDHSSWIALTHVDVICGSQCATHDHVCLRSPRHQAGICRDRKQKGAESCSWDPRQISAAVKGLARLVATAGEGCWILRTHDNCALIVPEGDRLVHRRSFKRPTVDVAVRLGLVVLGAERGPVPPFSAVPTWLKELGADPQTGAMALQGRTITRTEVAL